MASKQPITSNGMIIVCCSCKKIRDDQGKWTPAGVLTSRDTEDQFSHGICPECIKKLYPEFCREKVVNLHSPLKGVCL